MKNLWNTISFLGLSHLDKSEVLVAHKPTVLLNRMAFVIICLMMVFMPIDIFLHGPRLTLVVLADTLTVVLVLVINSYGKLEVAKYYFMCVSILLILPVTLFFSPGGGQELMFIPISTLGIVLLKNKTSGLLYAFLIYTICLLSLYLRQNIQPLIMLEPHEIKRVYPMFVCMSMIIVFFVVYYFKDISEEFLGLIRKQQEDLNVSYKLISEKNKEITDSINYAGNIQSSYLPPVDVFYQHIKNGFIYFKPKDIVSGDFYWFYREGAGEGKFGEHLFLAVADCTGHGVPGALMSVICCNALNEAVVNRKIHNTDAILNETRKLVTRMLKSKDGSGRKDGMDIALVKINTQTGLLQYSGANNPLYIIRSGESKIEELKPDKQPVGQFEAAKDFTCQQTQLSGGDTLYLFSDGFADQFGGPKGKKYKYSQLKELLVSLQSLSLIEQQHELERAFNNWKGELEQVDDVCIMGIRI